MDMLESFVIKAMERQINKKYPHIKYPSGVYARVTNVKMKEQKYICTLKILDKTMNADNTFSEIPNVKTDIEFKKGDIAIVLLLYGGSDFYILGRYES